MNPISGIYKITSPTGRVYIGQSTNIISRWKAHSPNSKKNHVLVSSLKKYGKKNHFFEIIKVMPENYSQDLINQYENFYLELYRTFGFRIMNIRSAGSKGRHSPATKVKMSLALKGRVMTPEAKEKLRTFHTGKKMSDETKNKIRLAHIGIKKSEENRIKAAKGKVGKKVAPCSEKRKEQLRKANSGKILSSGHKEKIRQSLLGKKHTEKRNKNRSEAVKRYYANKSTLPLGI